MDGEHNGAFTEQLRRTLNQGAFKGNYEEKYKERIEQGKEDVQNASGPIEKAKAIGNTDQRSC